MNPLNEDWQQKIQSYDDGALKGKSGEETSTNRAPHSDTQDGDYQSNEEGGAQYCSTKRTIGFDKKTEEKECAS